MSFQKGNNRQTMHLSGRAKVAGIVSFSFLHAAGFANSYFLYQLSASSSLIRNHISFLSSFLSSFQNAFAYTFTPTIRSSSC
jgi:uncharacterized Fe-S cluster-containing radical SAM superfamily protein